MSKKRPYNCILQANLYPETGYITVLGIFMKNLCKKALALMFMTVSIMSAQDADIRGDNDTRTQKLWSVAKVATVTGLVSGIAYTLNAQGISGAIAGFMSIPLMGHLIKPFVESKPEVTNLVVPTIKQKIEKKDRLIRAMRISSLLAACLSVGCFYASTHARNLWAKGFANGMGAVWTSAILVYELVVRRSLKQKKQLLDQKVYSKSAQGQFNQ